MVFRIKNFFFVCLLFTGSYFFYVEYIKLIKIDYFYKENQISKNLIIQNENLQNQEDIKFNERTYEKDYEIKKKEVVKLKDKKLKNNDEDLSKIEIVVSKGDTFISILNKYNIKEDIVFKIIQKIENIFDLRKLKINDKINLYTNGNQKIKKIEINNDIDSVLIINIEDEITIKIKKF